ncbi:hypothetical protein MTR67_053681 [Solanum verrucosum]|uniref:Uncharacterized protein n=1 Tax=Solanum verrucosum TaxID=315347 RepID=A0AAF0VB54_SOLVR|nr:hypothetical protein MTR67_053681 [Solanum verrucosum]
MILLLHYVVTSIVGLVSTNGYILRPFHQRTSIINSQNALFAKLKSHKKH